MLTYRACGLFYRGYFYLGGENMPNIEAKQAVIKEIREKIDKAKSMVLVDARGLSVAQDTQLRRTLREAGVDYKVYKNTLLTFAVEGTPTEGLKEYLFGPTTVAFSFDNPTLAASLISKQFKAMPKLTFKAGVIDGVVYDADGVKAIADIPPREVLLARLLGSFKSPVASFARVVKSVAESKENN
jgi:large subunit ribosomal protein L10